jgi:hypothetical protein
VSDFGGRAEVGLVCGRVVVRFGDARELESPFQNENESLCCGERVTVVGIAMPDLMRTPAALDVFGPQAFGLTGTFRPVEDLVVAGSVVGS